MRLYGSWGDHPPAPRAAREIRWRHEPLPRPTRGATLLPHGLGRSYGDSCLNDGGTLLDTTGLDHFIAFDAERGLLRCESGVTLDAILEAFVPRGWFLPVTPGTKYVTVGGALANDVHGKNHHRGGTFGCYVARFELLRSDGRRLVCSPEENRELFSATIGGLGLTGLVTWVEFAMKRIDNAWIDCESVRFERLEEFFELTEESDLNFEYTAAWVDDLPRGGARGRGFLFRGNHAAGGSTPGARRRSGRRLAMPVYAPSWLLNPWTVRTFNALYFHLQRAKVVRALRHHDPFFYPLDVVDDWNRLYGRRGLIQYQCVVPPADGCTAVREILDAMAAGGTASYLVVLKQFGKLPSPGLLSFPRPGVTLALDFPHLGRRTLAMLETLDAIVRRRGGRVYPAKDTRMSAASFQAYYPEWRTLAAHVDPAFSSSFWRRVTGGPGPN